MMEKTARQAELKKSGKLVLRLNPVPQDKQPRDTLKELVKFKTFPTIIADKGITVGRLSELTGAEGGIADLVIYNVGMGIECLQTRAL